MGTQIFVAAFVYRNHHYVVLFERTYNFVVGKGKPTQMPCINIYFFLVVKECFLPKVAAYSIIFLVNLNILNTLDSLEFWCHFVQQRKSKFRFSSVNRTMTKILIIIVGVVNRSCWPWCRNPLLSNQGHY